MLRRRPSRRRAPPASRLFSTVPPCSWCPSPRKEVSNPLNSGLKRPEQRAKRSGVFKVASGERSKDNCRTRARERVRKFHLRIPASPPCELRVQAAGGG